jgi:flagellar basal body-associated protein FliL
LRLESGCSPKKRETFLKILLVVVVVVVVMVVVVV